MRLANAHGAGLDLILASASRARCARPLRADPGLGRVLQRLRLRALSVLRRIFCRAQADAEPFTPQCYAGAAADNPALQLDARGIATMCLSLYQSRISCLTFCVRSALQFCCSEVRDRIRPAACDVTSRSFGVTRIEGFSRRKPVVVRTTPAGAVLPTSLGAGSRPVGPLSPRQDEQSRLP
jgi:hypothetical protein